MPELGSLLQNPIVGVVAGGSFSKLLGGDGFGLNSCVVIESTNRVKSTVYFQFNPELNEDISNKIDSFSPIKGNRSYANYVNRELEKFTLSGMYYARTKDEGEKMESFAQYLREIAQPEDNELPKVKVYLPFKRDVIEALVSNVSIKYSSDYISSSAISKSSVVSSMLNLFKSASGATTDLPRRIDFTVDLIRYYELPEISSILSDLAKTTNYYISNARRGSSSGRTKSKESKDDQFWEAIDSVTEK